MRFDQSSPVHLVSESKGGTLSVTDKVRTEILVSNYGFSDPNIGKEVLYYSMEHYIIKLYLKLSKWHIDLF